MKTDLSHVLIPLRKSELLRVVDGAGRAVAVFSGTVWVTQEGDLADHVLGAGEVFTLDRGGLALVAALEDSTLTFVDPQPGRVRPGADVN